MALGAGRRAARHHLACSMWCAYVHERKQFGQPIGTFQLVRADRRHVHHDDDRGLCLRGGQACDRGGPRARTAGAILYASEGHLMRSMPSSCWGQRFISDYPTGGCCDPYSEIGAGAREIRVRSAGAIREVGVIAGFICSARLMIPLSAAACGERFGASNSASSVACRASEAGLLRRFIFRRIAAPHPAMPIGGGSKGICQSLFEPRIRLRYTIRR